MDSSLYDLYASSNVNDIYDFYDLLNSQKDVIDFLTKYPTSEPTGIVEVPGDTSIAVVIPTKSAENKFCETCRKIYKGMTILFVESGDSNFFRLEHNVNIGFEAARRCDPEWLIYSNDDMILIDAPETLRSQLDQWDSSEDVLLLAMGDGQGVSVDTGIFSETPFTWSLCYQPISSSIRKMFKIRKKLEQRYFVRQLNINRLSNLVSRAGFFNLILPYVNLGAFGVFSRSMMERYQYRIFDELFLNWHEDQDVSLSNITRSAKINYRIGTYPGQTLGTGERRYLRGIVSDIYLDFKIRSHYSSMNITQQKEEFE